MKTKFVIITVAQLITLVIMLIMSANGIFAILFSERTDWASSAMQFASLSLFLIFSIYYILKNVRYLVDLHKQK
jgi:hypothetical protein